MNRDACPTSVSPLIVPEIVAFPAEIDITNAARVGDELRAALVPGVSVVIADMSRTLFCDSSGIRCLVIAHELAVANQAELRIVIESPAVFRMLKITAVDQILTIYPCLQAALAAEPARTPEAT